jgi:hypothetical protein
VAAPESQHRSTVYVLRRRGSGEGVLDEVAGVAGARRFRAGLVICRKASVKDL